MAQLIFKNNSQSSLQAGIGPTATSAVLQAGTGVLFAQPVVGSGQYFVGTFIDAATGLANEIVWVTGRVGDTLTMVRAQEGTTATTWNPGDSFAELWTAGQCQAMLQSGDEQSGATTFGIDSGVANAYSTTLTPALVANTMGQALRIKIANSNTGASTINFGIGASPLRNSQGLPLSGGELIASYVYECYWNGAGYNLALPSLSVIPTGMIVPFAGGTVPGGWLACNGQAVSKDVYPALFGVIGTQYGGTGLPLFNVPDTRGRVIAGLDGGANRLTNATMAPDGNTLGGAGGQQQVSAAVSTSVSVSVSGGISGSTSGGLAVDVGSDVIPTSGSGNSGSGSVFQLLQPGTQVNSHGDAHGSLGVSGSFSGSGSGSGTGTTATATNVQPTLVASYMIKT
jgi:microcystin-dependent protein